MFVVIIIQAIISRVSPRLYKLMMAYTSLLEISPGILLAHRKPSSRNQEITDLFMSTSTFTTLFPSTISTG